MRSTDLARSSYIGIDVTSVAFSEEIPVKCTIVIGIWSVDDRDNTRQGVSCVFVLDCVAHDTMTMHNGVEKQRSLHWKGMLSQVSLARTLLRTQSCLFIVDTPLDEVVQENLDRQAESEALSKSMKCYINCC